MSSLKPYIDEDGEVRELDQYFFKNAFRGRPPLLESQHKKRVSIMLDPDVIAHFKAGGKGWQACLNAKLREIAGLKLVAKVRKAAGRPSRSRNGNLHGMAP